MDAPLKFDPASGISGRNDEGGPAATIISSPPSLTQGRRLSVPSFVNDMGMIGIKVGVEALNCIGATPPYDHPQVYLDMAGRTDILCPRCATRFFYDPRLEADETEPPDCFFDASSLPDQARFGALPELLH